MTTEQNLASQLFIKLDGTAVDQPIMNNVTEVMVDQHAHLPDMFVIKFLDPELKMLDEGPFDLVKTVEIEAEKEDGQKSTLIKGEITALEPSFGEGMEMELVVQGYDKSHRLYRESKSRTFVNMKDSDIADKIAKEIGLQAEIDATSIPYEHIYQDNLSDLAFLMQRAWRIGYECFVSDGKLFFRRPVDGSAQVTLTWGENLLSFHPRLTLAEQVDEVLVKGWDIDKQAPIVGQAQNGRLYPAIQESKDGASWAGGFGKGKMIIVDQPVVSQSEANSLAEARLNEISGAFIEAEGEAFRSPDIKAGQTIKLESLGKRFSGTYLVTNAAHIYTPEGLKTRFAVRGARVGTFSEQLLRQRPLPRWPGAVTAVVTNTQDPKDWGRVKVKFPWITDEAESDWARVVSAGAGPEAGSYCIPDVEDEVLVAFEYGDFNRPYVLGGLWNGKNAIPPDAASASGGDKPKVRAWYSRGGHKIVLDDANSKLEIITKDGLTISLDDGGSKITIESSSEIEIKGGGDMEVTADGNMKLKASGNMDIEAGGQLKVKGSTIDLN